MPERTVIKMLGTLLLAGVAAGSASAETLFESGVAGIQVTGQTIAGIAGGAPWDVAAGEARIESDGELRVEVEGLVLVTPLLPEDPVFPVAGVCGILVCQKTVVGDPTNEPVAATGNFPLSPVTGNAEVREEITLPPAACVAPIVLVGVSAVDSGFFAPECMGGAGTCTPTGVAVEIGCAPAWIAASGL